MTLQLYSCTSAVLRGEKGRKMVLFVPSMSVVPASRGRTVYGLKKRSHGEVLNRPARTARWLSPQPGQPTWASRARVSVWKENQESKSHSPPLFFIPINPLAHRVLNT